MPRLLVATLVACVLLGVLAVDRSNFKTCSQSGFCERNRQLAETRLASGSPSPYEAREFASLSARGGELTTVLDHTLSSGEKVALELRLQNLAAGGLRVKINEVNELGRAKRYQAKDSLAGGKPALRDFVAVRGTQGGKSVVLELDTAGTKAELHLAPFKLTLRSAAGAVLIELNSRALLSFEHYRGPAGRQPGDSDNMWSETFKTHADSKPHGPMSVACDISFPEAAQVYGIPEHATSLALKYTRGAGAPYSEPYRLYNLDVFEYELDNPMALYGSIPFMHAHSTTHGTAGVLWLNPSETWVDVSARSGGGVDTHWMSETGVIDVFLFPGSTAADVLRAYTMVTGPAPLPPLFSLGYHQCKWNYRDEADVAAVDRDLDAHGLPYDVIWLDIEHTDGKRYFTWDPRHFPTPQTMLSGLEHKRRHLVTIVDPHIKRDDNYEVHKEAQDKKLYIKKAGDDADYEGWCWPGSSGYPDFTQSTVREWWASRFALDSYKGSALNQQVWNDMNEPSVFNGPEVSMHKDARHGAFEHRDVHNMYGLYVHQGTYEGLLARTKGVNRPFVLSRAFFPGSQRYGAIWTGDNKADWEHLRASSPMLLSISMAGLSFAGADVGGFFGNPDVELLTRFYQAGSFFPFFRAHAHIDSKRREPYLFGDHTTAIMRGVLRNRYALLPYIYTQFYLHSTQGAPMMRPLWMEFPTDEASLTIDESFLLGPSLLVHPISAPGVTSTDIYLPSQAGALWYDYWTGARILPSQYGTQKRAVAEDHVPVFLRGGSILPKKMRPRRNSAAMSHDPYTLVVAPDSSSSASGLLYIDDELTTADAHLLVSCAFADNTLSCTPTGKNQAGLVDLAERTMLERVIVLGVKKAPKSVELNGASSTASSVHFELESAGVLTVHKVAVSLHEPLSLRLVF